MRKVWVAGIFAMIILTGSLINNTKVQAQICEIEGCNQTEKHKHYDCGVKDCVQSGVHHHVQQESHHSGHRNKGHH